MATASMTGAIPNATHNILPFNLMYLGDGLWQIPDGGIYVAGFFLPPGFITDLDTLPRIPLFYRWLKNRSIVGAATHDYLYSTLRDREYSDRIFLAVMKEEGVKRRYRLPIYWGVRAFGWTRYGRKKYPAVMPDTTPDTHPV